VAGVADEIAPSRSLAIFAASLFRASGSRSVYETATCQIAVSPAMGGPPTQTITTSAKLCTGGELLGVTI